MKIVSDDKHPLYLILEKQGTQGFEPSSLKFPKYVSRGEDDMFKNIADTIYERSLKGRKEISSAFKQPTLPIEQTETKHYFERQISSR